MGNVVVHIFKCCLILYVTTDEYVNFVVSKPIDQSLVFIVLFLRLNHCGLRPSIGLPTANTVTAFTDDSQLWWRAVQRARALARAR